MEKKQSNEFMQGFLCGFCALLDMLRVKGLEGLPDEVCRAFVIFADGAEANLKSGPLAELLGPYQSEEVRSGLLAMMLKHAGRDRAATK